MTSSLVLGHNALVDHAVDDRHCFLESRLRSCRVTGVARLDDALDLGAHARTQAHVVLASFLGLDGAFSRGLDVCHCITVSGVKEPRIIRAPGGIVNDRVND